VPEPTDQNQPTPLWKNPAVVVPIIVALIAAAVAIPLLLPERDRTSPQKAGEGKGTCKEGETAPVQNYINYVDDAWMTHFTPGQFKRMKENIALFPPMLLSPEQRALASLE